MPIVFSPPAVSALNTSVARYFSGSRVLTPDSGAGELLALTFAAVVFVFAATLTFALVFVSDAGRQLLTTMTSRIVVAKQKNVGLLIELRIEISRIGCQRRGAYFEKGVSCGEALA
jgi:hypothetical protein